MSGRYTPRETSNEHGLLVLWTDSKREWEGEASVTEIGDMRIKRKLPSMHPSTLRSRLKNGQDVFAGKGEVKQILWAHPCGTERVQELLSYPIPNYLPRAQRGCHCKRCDDRRP